MTYYVRKDVPHFVYRCYDSTGRLLYVGCTNSVAQRLQTHEAGSWWWPEVATIRNLLFPNREKALEMEREAIWNERPRCNVKGRWYRADPREDWTATEYVEFHGTVLKTATVIGVNTAKLLTAIEAEVGKRHGVSIPREWGRRSA